MKIAHVAASPDLPADPAAAAFAPRRILVIVTRQIGDVLLTTPLLEAAHARWPEATIDVLGFAGTLGMLQGRSDVAARIEIGARGWRPMPALVRRLWRRYDLALVAEASDRAHLLGFVAAPVRAGLVPERRAHAWWKRLLLRHAVGVAGDRGQTHVAAEKLALLMPWAGGAARLPMLSPPPGSPLPDDLERALGAAPIVVHAPSMWRYKQWPVENFRVVVAALLSEGRQVVLTGGSSTADREKVAPLAALGQAPQLLDACGRLDFAQLSTLLARAALYIGPDTSVTHLAAAAGVPLVALFGPTNPLRWGPIGSSGAEPPFERRSLAPQRRGRIILMQGPGDCVPCGRAGCEDHRDSVSECLEGISPQSVLAEADRLLREPRPAATAAR